MAIDTEEIQSDFLFARPSLLEGFARLADFGGVLNAYNQSGSGDDADARALFEDWKAVGHDLRAALQDSTGESDEQS